MSVNATNRIENDPREIRQVINTKVEEYERRKRARSKHSFVAMTQKTVLCSQCQRKMLKKIADIQVKNKRENAPICTACCMGIPRKKLENIEDRTKFWKPETKQAFENYKHNYKKST